MNHNYIEYCISLGIPAEFAALMEREKPCFRNIREKRASDQLVMSFMWGSSDLRWDFWKGLHGALLDGARYGECK